MAGGGADGNAAPGGPGGRLLARQASHGTASTSSSSSKQQQHGRSAAALGSSPALQRATSAKASPVPSYLRPTSSSSHHAARGLEVQLNQLIEVYETMEAEAKASSTLMANSIKQGRQAWLALKQENKELQAQMAQRGTQALQAAGRSAVERRLEQLESRVHDLRRQHDKIMQEKKTALSKLQNVQDSLQQQGKGQALGMDSKEARSMRQLENRLDKAQLKANEASSIQHTYEQLLARLREEQQAFDPALKALEAAVRQGKQELQQAQAEQREAQRLKEAAKQELAQVEERVARERSERAARLDAERATVKGLGDANSALLARQFQSAAAAGVAMGGKLTGTGQQQLSGGLEAEPLPPVATPQQAVAALLAAAPGGAGAGGVEALCVHLLAQHETFRGLNDMKQAAVHKVNDVSMQVDVAKAVLQDLKSGGRGRTTQAALDAAQAQLQEANAAAEQAKRAHDVVMKAYVDVRAGVEHLAGMLVPLPLPPGHVPVPVSDDTLGDVLAQCQQRLVASMHFIGTLPRAAALLESMMNNPELSFSARGPDDDDDDGDGL